MPRHNFSFSLLFFQGNVNTMRINFEQANAKDYFRKWYKLDRKSANTSTKRKWIGPFRNIYRRAEESVEISYEKSQSILKWLNVKFELLYSYTFWKSTLLCNRRDVELSFECILLFNCNQIRRLMGKILPLFMKNN